MVRFCCAVSPLTQIHLFSSRFRRRRLSTQCGVVPSECLFCCCCQGLLCGNSTGKSLPPLVAAHTVASSSFSSCFCWVEVFREKPQTPRLLWFGHLLRAQREVHHVVREIALSCSRAQNNNTNCNKNNKWVLLVFPPEENSWDFLPPHFLLCEKCSTL